MCLWTLNHKVNFKICIQFQAAVIGLWKIMSHCMKPLTRCLVKAALLANLMTKYLKIYGGV